LQRFHLAGHAWAWAGAARENDIGDPDVIGQTSERFKLAILIRQCEVRNLADDRQIALPGTFHFCQTGNINKPEQPEAQTHAEPDSARKLFGSLSHARDQVAAGAEIYSKLVAAPDFDFSHLS
jgi:hypothetical protein